MLCGTKQLDYPYFPFRISVDFVLTSKRSDVTKILQRTLFEQACRREGLLVNHEYAGDVCFTLISCPFHRLCREAEKIQMPFPLNDCPVNPALPSCCITLSNMFVSDDSVANMTAPFQRKYGPLFVDYGNEKVFFNSAQRGQLTYQILSQLDISKEARSGTTPPRSSSSEQKEEEEAVADSDLQRKGMDFLVMDGAFDDAFPLHDPSEVEPYFKKMKRKSMMCFLENVGEMEEDPRKNLYEKWSRFFKRQPLNMVRDYFGEQISFYFAWHGTFLTMLGPASLLGIAVFIYGIVDSVHRNPVGLNNCTVLNMEGEEEYMPCQIMNGASKVLNSLTVWLTKAFDNQLNPFYAAFMSIWGSLFYQIWRRNSSVLCYRWNCEETQRMEPDRAEYVGGASKKEDPITGETEWLTPQLTRYFKMGFSALVVLFCMCLVIISVFLVTVYKLWAVKQNECKQNTAYCSLIAAFLPSFLNTVSTMLLGWAYGQLVEKLNSWENHRTRSDHDNALVIKIFAFQFVNNYTSLFYVAFIRPEYNGFQQDGLFGLGADYKDVCVKGTCGSLLAVQLLSHVLVKPLPKFSKDVVVPLLIRMYRLARWKKEHQPMREILSESDESNLLVREWMKPDAGDFALWEFNEKIILFGTTMMFASLFPLAPLLALLIGAVDLRIDVHRLLWFNRRPIPEPADGIGIWLPILVFLQYAAVMTNAFIIAFTSDFCTNFFDDDFCDVKNRLVIVIVFQNLVFVLKYVIQSIIPTVPASIKVARRRRRYIIAHITEKGDLPYKIKSRKRTRRAKLAWITSIRSNAIDTQKKGRGIEEMA